MKISRERLTSEAQATGFRPGLLEKVVHLLNLLEGFNSHPFLKGRWVLKGGTALNLFHGRIEPERLTADPAMADRIKSHPSLRWKAFNVREHKAR